MAEETVRLPKDTSRALMELTGEPRMDVALTMLMREYARHKLAEFEESLARYTAKYQMPFETYRQIWESEDREEDFAYEAEQDYLNWEALVTQRNRLQESFAWLP